jgi:uncharacterized protein
MQFDLRQLGRHGGDEHLDRTFEPAQFDTPGAADEDYEVAAPVHLVLDVHKDREAYRVTGRVETRLRLECSRCLEPFEIPVASAFELRYVPAPAATGAGHGHSGHGEEVETEVAEDDLTTAYYKDETLDLGELLHEQFVLALPMKPLCSDACKGLCPSCGTNLNKGTCDCKPAWTDPRLAGLQGILDRQSQASAGGEPEGPRARSEVGNLKGPHRPKIKKES